MCGIGGYYSEKGISPDVLMALSGMIRHRGPDDEGYLCIDKQGRSHPFLGKDSSTLINGLPDIREAEEDRFSWGMIHRRLSILDLSTLGHQPMGDERGNYILFNGEIYNYKELRATLEARGHSFFSHTDTEVVLKAYSEWGTDCFSRFRGMWALAILDHSTGKLLLSRDRFAIKPLYITSGKVFAFASEPKALLCIPGISAELDEGGLFDYMAYGGSEDPDKTLFRDIREFPAGCWMEVLDGKPGPVVPYYDLEEEVRKTSVPKNLEAQGLRYRELFSDSVKIHLRADVPVGSCLSGGLDSSAIVAASASMMPDKEFRTFTAAYDDPDVDESTFADRLNHHYPNIQGSFTTPDEKTLWEDYRKLLWHQDLPIHSTSMFAQWEVMKLAGSTGMKVLMDGQGADEALGGYDNFLGAYLLRTLLQLRWVHHVKRANELKRNRYLDVDHELARAAFQYLPPGLRRAIRRNLRLGEQFLSKEFRKSMGQRPIPQLSSPSPHKLQRISLTRGLKELLRYEDRNSMAFSIESRVPFLDHKLVEYTLALPLQSLSHKGYSKYILRSATADILPSSIAWRKDKKGFITPQGQWQKDSRAKIREFLENMAIPPMFDKETILAFSRKELSVGTPSNEFWKLIAILVWKDVFKVRF